jgi:hypothetical protein
MNNYDGPFPDGVPNPFAPMLHSYPTRFHGPIYTRPMFSLDWAERPNDFAVQPGMMGIGQDLPAPGSACESRGPNMVTDPETGECVEKKTPWGMYAAVAAGVGVVAWLYMRSR